MSDPVARVNAALEGRYRIESELGEGGMATVYLADDLKHERKVALKVLKPELAAVVGAERFLAEIKTTANLQHPHILPLHDSGEADGVLYYVMPFIEGETLKDRLDRERQLPIDEALGIATAIANALQTAHEAGVVHRDIKPANILLSRGEPLVADFGIALAMNSAGGSRLTETGLSVGTPFYMSPEQATGDQVVGPASDTFALGCVLYEMLIGEPPYPGSTAQAVLGKIIQGLPVSATVVRKSIPFHVDAAIRKALEKLPADRFTSAQAFAKALADPSFRHGDDPLEARSSGGGRWKGIAIGASAVAAGLAAFTAVTLLRPPEPGGVERYSLRPLDGQGPSVNFDVSDDGSAWVFSAERGGVSYLVIRRLGELEGTRIPGTEGGTYPALSPDGTNVAFIVNGEVTIAPLEGGVVRSVAGDANCCLRWGDDGNISFTEFGGSLLQVSPDGGTPEVLLEVGPGDSYGGFVADVANDVGLFTNWADDLYRIEAVRISTGERRVVGPGLDAFLTDEGFLVFASLDGQILAARFDAGAMALDGPAVPLVTGVSVSADGSSFLSVARDGTLLYWSGPSQFSINSQVVRVDRGGEVTPVDTTFRFNAGNAPSLALSPSGQHLALKIRTGSRDEIWVKELDGGPASILVGRGGRDLRPRWSHDGENIHYISLLRADMSDSDLWSQPYDGSGTPELLLDLEGSIMEAQLTPNGATYALRLGSVTGTRNLVSFKVGESDTRPVAVEPYDAKSLSLSPDGSWIAYESNETGVYEIYVRPFPNSLDGKALVSTAGGLNPKWAHSGEELFYVNGAGEMIAATVSTDDGSFTVGDRTVLFNLNERGILSDQNYTVWDIDRDDQGFLMIQLEGGGVHVANQEFVLVRNWIEELRARVVN